MSEYQYYEFAAIDRPLSKDEMAELRALSSRATISPTRFVNEYHWGDLKGDPAQWMRRYFDAFVYTANWCSCRLALRVPHEVFKKRDLTPFLSDDGALTVADAKTHWIIDWSLDDSDDDERFATEDGRGWMGRLAPLRDELMRGDLRPLYIGWLAGVGGYDVEDDAIEPPVPVGMSQLTAAQQALVEFLGIDPDLISAAAAGSGDAAEWNDDDSVEVWLAGLPKREMNLVFAMLLQGESLAAERRVKSEFLAWQKESGSIEESSSARRTVVDLRMLVEAAAEHRDALAAKESARQEEERGKQRAAHLRELAEKFEQCWDAIELNVERATATSYAAAVGAIADLAEACALTSRSDEFERRLRLFMGRHAKRSALVRRLAGAGLSQKG
jgi:hypothetical protein